MLLKKFKTMATLKSDDQHATGLPMNEYILQHHDLLASFYKFKKRYEIILVVLSAAIMTWMVFRIYSTGGVNAHPTAASIILSCRSLHAPQPCIQKTRKISKFLLSSLRIF